MQKKTSLNHLVRNSLPRMYIIKLKALLVSMHAVTPSIGKSYAMCDA